MFQNNNKAVIKHLAKNNLHADPTRRYVTTLTIALSVCLILAVSLVVVGNEAVHISTQESKAQVKIGVTEDQLAKLKKQPDVEWAGEYANIGYSYQKDITLNVVYEDQTQIENQEDFSYEGTVPIAENEVMLPSNYLSYLHSDAKPGDIISLDLTGLGQKRDYRISAVLDYEKQTDSYIVWVSKKGAQALLKDNPVPVIAYTRLKTDAVDSSDIMDFTYKAIQSTGIDRRQIQLTDYFAVMSGGDRKSEKPIVIILGLIVMALAGIVIYSIFYSSVIKKVHQYGQLRTIGMTKKQVRKMVRMEGRKLASYGIPLGIISGLIIGYLMCPNGFRIKNAVVWTIIVSLFALITIKLSMNKSVKIAANTSPIEGSRFSFYTGNKKVKKAKHKLTPYYLALMHFNENRKRTAVTVLMLGLSGILLVTTSILAKSLNAEKMVRFISFPKGELYLYIQNIPKSTFSNDIDYNWNTRLQQKNNPLNESLQAQIKAIDGVKDVTPYNGVSLTITSTSFGGMITSMRDTIPTLTKEECTKINPILKEGTADYDILTKQNGIIISSGEANAKVGSECQISGLGKDGQPFSMDLPVVGVYNNSDLMEKYPLMPGSPSFLITDESVRKLMGVTDQTGYLAISVEPEKLDAVTKQVKAIADASDEIDMEKLSDSVERRQKMFDEKVQMLYAIAAIIFVFGIISLINTVITQLNSRKLEFGLLQAEGMTSRQVEKMLVTENLFYTGGAAILSLGIGSILGFILCNIIEKKAHCIIFHFEWPIVLVFLLSLLVIQMLLSAYTISSFKKTSIIDRLRMPE